MTIVDFRSVVEALLFAAGDAGLSRTQMATVLEVSDEVVQEIIDDVQAAYAVHERGLQIVEVAGVYQLVTKKQYAPHIQKLVEVPSIAALSQAVLETLAIIAYQQPITRAEIADIRGVNVDGALQKLVNRGLIKEVGRVDAVGRPILYGTTTDFLEYFGLKSLAEMPELPVSNLSDDDEVDLFSFKYEGGNEDEKETKTD